MYYAIYHMVVYHLSKVNSLIHHNVEMYNLGYILMLRQFSPRTKYLECLANFTIDFRNL